MGRVKSELFTETDSENFNEIFGQPEYLDWSNEYDRQAEQIRPLEPSREDRPEAHKEDNVR